MLRTSRNLQTTFYTNKGYVRFDFNEDTPRNRRIFSDMNNFAERSRARIILLDEKGEHVQQVTEFTVGRFAMIAY